MALTHDRSHVDSLILFLDSSPAMRSQQIGALHEVAGVPIIKRVIDSCMKLKSLESLESLMVSVVCLDDSRLGDSNLTDSRCEELTAGLSAIGLDRVSVVTLGQLERLDVGTRRAWITSGDVPNLSSALLERLDRAQPDARVLGASADELALIRAESTLLASSLSVLSSELSSELSGEPESRRGDDAVSEALKAVWRQLSRALTASGSGAEPGAEPARLELRDAEALELERVRDRVDLARAESRAQSALAAHLMRGGATLIRPETVRLDARVEVGEDVLIEEDVTLLGSTLIEAGAVIERGCRITNSVISAGAHVRAYSHLEGAWVGEAVSVGPFARLREGTRLERGAKVGNFVEIKKTTLGEDAKASHLSYLGDAHIGRGANIGAGTITCNYDGYQKHKTEVGEGAFIGSDTQLVAPVKVGAGAIVAAGTTVTRDVEPDALVLTRPEAVTRASWAARFRARHKES